MNVIHVIGSYALVLSLSTVGISAARSDAADAAMKGDGTALRAVLQRKADVNAPQADGATALHWAVYRNDLEMADVLIRAGADPRAANRDGATVLSLACVNGNSAMIEKLLNSGASANERGPNGETALMMASRTGNVDAIRLLLDRGAEVNAKENLRGTTALMWAAAQANAPAVQLLVERGADAGARSNAVAKGRTAYLAPTPAERARSGDSAGSRRGGGGTQSATPAVDQDLAERVAFLRRDQDLDGGGLTALVFAARQGDLESARILLAAKADVNQITQYGWTPLLTATQNRNYKLASFLLDNGADPNLANKGGWTPLYLATDNRNIEKGDYPTRQPDVDHLEFIKKLLKNGANVNTRAKDSTETRTIFTHQWLYEDGATPFLRAAQSGDVTLMKLLLQHGADPNIATTNKTTPLMAAAGIGWVEGVTFESSAKENLEAVKLLLDLGADVNAVDGDGRTALHGAAHKGRTEVVQILADHGARLDARDVGSRDTIAGELVGHTWQPLDYAEGLVRVGVQSAVAHPETAALIRKLMTERGLPVPPEGRTLQSICVVEICK